MRFLAFLLFALALGATSQAEILKFDVGPEGQTAFPGFTALGPENIYNAEVGHGWVAAPDHFTSFRKWAAFPDALVCDLAAPSKPLTGQSSGYSGAFEFRVDLPPGDYGVALLSGNYEYLPSQIEARAYDLERGEYRVPANEKILANGREVWSRSFTSDDLVREFYHDLDRPFRRKTNLWDRTIAWRFPARSFAVSVAQENLVLRFENMPINAIIIWPASEEKEARSFLDQLVLERRASFPAKDITPAPEDPMPPLPEGAETNGYFFFVPHWSDRVRTTTIPRPEWIKTEAQASVARGEFESIALGVFPLRDLTGCSVAISELAGPDGARLPADATDLRMLRYLDLQAGDGAAYETVAHLPAPARDIALDERIPGMWWLTVHLPETASPGEYTGKISFRAANVPSSTLDLKLRVLPFRLRPLKDRFQALFHDHYWFPGGGLDRRVQWQRDAGFNVIAAAGAFSGLTCRDGKVRQADFSDWENQLNVYRRNGFPMRLVVSQGALAAAYRATGEYFTEPDFRGAHQVKDRFSARFERCYKQLARTITNEFKRRKWPEIVFYDSGEAAGEGPRAVRTETHLMRLLHEAGVKSTTSVSGPATPLSLRRSAPHMYLTLLAEVNAENIRKVRQAGSILGLYGAGETRFGRGFWFWRTGAMICSDEGGLIVYGNPYDPFDGARRRDWGDVYPTPEGPTPSVHAIAKREGIDDSRYLFHLEGLIAEAKARGNAQARQAAARAEATLKELAQSIELDSTYYGTMAEEPPGHVLDKMRAIVAAHIETLESVRQPQ